MTVELGRIGIWCGPLRRGDRRGAIAAAQAIQRLGFATAWMPGGEEGLAERVGDLLGATTALQLATGIVTVWDHPAEAAARLFRETEVRFPGRFLLGVGIGHEPLVSVRYPGRYEHPVATVERYLLDLDRAEVPVPIPRRLLAAFGPRMLDLAARRTAGAHPYLVTPGHTRFARQVLGAGPLLAPEQHVVLEGDPARARAVAREYLTTYWTLPNYIANFRRMGFDDVDFEGGGSDRLVDELVAWGGPDVVLDRVEQHFAAGADHVAVQVLVPGRAGFPVAGWEELADAVRRRTET